MSVAILEPRPDFWAKVRIKPRLSAERVGDPICIKYGVTLFQVRAAWRTRDASDPAHRALEECLLALAEADVPHSQISKYLNAKSSDAVKDAIDELRGFEG